LVQGAGGNLDVSYINRVRIKKGGGIVLDATLAAIRAMTEAVLPNSMLNATTGFRLVIPFYNPEAILLGQHPESRQLEPGEPQVEIDLGAFTPAAGDMIRMAWVRTNVPALAYTRYLASALAWAASSNQQTKPITDRGIWRGFCLNNTGLTRGRIVVAGSKAWEVDTIAHQGAVNLDSPMVLANPLFQKFNAPYPALGGGPAEIVADLGAGWAGVSNELTNLLEIPIAAG
jgi:hypothetical protein